MHHHSFCWRNQAEAETPTFREKEKSSALLVLSGMNTLGLEHGKVEKRYFPLPFLPSIHCFPNHEQILSSPLDHQDQVFLENPSDQIDPKIDGKNNKDKKLAAALHHSSVSMNLYGAAYKPCSLWIQGARDVAALTEAKATQEESTVSWVTPGLIHGEHA